MNQIDEKIDIILNKIADVTQKNLGKATPENNVQNAEILKEINLLLDENPLNLKILTLMATFKLFDLEDYEDARKYFNKILEIAPNSQYAEDAKQSLKRIEQIITKKNSFSSDAKNICQNRFSERPLVSAKLILFAKIIIFAVVLLILLH